MKASATGLLPLIMIAGCAAAQPPTVPPKPGTGGCPIVDSSDWFAVIDAMPGPNGPRLVVSGKVRAPTGGYRFELAGMQALRSDPVQVVVHLRQLPPIGGPPSVVTLVVETHEVRGEWPMQPPVGSVTVRCGEREVARIAPVGTAH